MFDFTALYCFPVIVHGQAVQERLFSGSVAVVGRITSQNNKGGAASKSRGRKGGVRICVKGGSIGCVLGFVFHSAS